MASIRPALVQRFVFAAHAVTVNTRWRSISMCLYALGTVSLSPPTTPGFAPCVRLMLGQRRRRWFNIKPTQGHVLC